MSTTITTTVIEQTPIVKEYKVFVGNLSFKTSKDTLTSFAETSGKVLETTIITRGTRSLGYGFIKFETEKEAQKAAQDLNHQSLEGREINVEVARPKPDDEVTKPRKTRKSKRTSHRNKSNADNNTETEVNEVAIAKKELTKKSEKKATKEVAKEATPTTTTTTSSDSSSTEEDAAARRKRNRKNKKRQNKKSAEKAARVTEPSKSTLFVANLPYATTDDDLVKIFGAYELLSAHVARMKNGRSKGYGFVEFENEQDQVKALEQVKDVVLEGRAIYLKIALSEQKAPQQGEVKEKEVVKTDEVKKEDPAAKKEETAAKKEEPVAAKKEVLVASKKEEPAVVKKKESVAVKKEVPAVITAIPAKKEAAAPEKKEAPAATATPAKKEEPVAAAKKVEPVKEVKKETPATTESKIESLKVNDTKK